MTLKKWLVMCQVKHAMQSDSKVRLDFDFGSSFGWWAAALATNSPFLQAKPCQEGWFNISNQSRYPTHLSMYSWGKILHIIPIVTQIDKACLFYTTRHPYHFIKSSWDETWMNSKFCNAGGWNNKIMLNNQDGPLACRLSHVDFKFWVLLNT